ncbi:MAG: cytochrome C [Gammaproteobacteria bacterium]|nr:cytochrome C [Gammaproteobacteria bacterium]
MHLRVLTTFLIGALLMVLNACSSTVVPGDPLDQFEPVVATTVMAAPEPGVSAVYAPEMTARGKYMVELLGCGACHTNGALLGEPDAARLLAGSRIGIAHSNPLQVKYPAIVFPSNLTPDDKTGVGLVSDKMLAAAIRGGVGRHGSRVLKVMPVAAYANISDADVDAIVAYLRSLPPVEHLLPAAVPEGRESDELYVHFGVYRSRE